MHKWDAVQRENHATFLIRGSIVSQFENDAKGGRVGNAFANPPTKLASLLLLLTKQ